MSKIPFWAHAKGALKGRTLNWLANETGIPINTIHGWITKGVIPPSDRGVIIASALNVTVEYLVTGRNPEPDECVIKMKNSPATRRIVKALLKLPEKDVEKVWLGLVGILSALGYGREEEKGDADSMVG